MVINSLLKCHSLMDQGMKITIPLSFHKDCNYYVYASKIVLR